ncbi:MAG TPA: hypothetical protein VLJ86_22045 [Ramlibacter sp.]|nr:hypothetical protein [Ramlibacter sp.]
MSREDNLSTADLVAGSDRNRAEARQQEQAQALPAESAELAQAAEPGALHAQRHAEQPMDAPPPQERSAGAETEQLVALFPPGIAQDFRSRWDTVQIGFVDDPQRAVQQADELVAQVMKSLAESFAQQRSQLEAGLGKGDQTNTEDLRVALRSYRSFFMRLLSL